MNCPLASDSSTTVCRYVVVARPYSKLSSVLHWSVYSLSLSLLQCLELQIAMAFPNPQNRIFPGTEFFQENSVTRVRASAGGRNGSRNVLGTALGTCFESRSVMFTKYVTFFAQPCLNLAIMFIVADCS